MKQGSLPYLAYDDPITRPELVLPEGVTHITNLTGGDLFYWAARNELFTHLFRKRHLAERYDPWTLILGEPRAHAPELLIEQGIIGIYGRKWSR